MFGVRASPPYAPKSEKPASSTTMTTMLGRVGAAFADGACACALAAVVQSAAIAENITPDRFMRGLPGLSVGIGAHGVKTLAAGALTTLTQYPTTDMASEATSLGPALPSYVWERAMRLEPNLLKCVVFIGHETPAGFVPCGTGFIIQHIYDSVSFHFLATAAHVIRDFAGDTFSVRINRMDGRSECIKVKKGSELKHPDAAADLAVFGIPVAITPDVHDITSVDVGRQTRDQEREIVGGIHVGDEVCAIGLYTSHHGAIRNAPVARTGHIAALPGEPVRVLGGLHVEAYLIELRTIAGLSGSPVFYLMPPVRVMPNGGVQAIQKDKSPGVPLGVLVGYHVVESKEDQIQVPRFGHVEAAASGNDQSIDERNTGFGVVVPIERLDEIFEHPEFVEAVKRDAAAFKARKDGYKPAG